jgi:hypothetical protein
LSTVSSAPFDDESVSPAPKSIEYGVELWTSG